MFVVAAFLCAYRHKKALCYLNYNLEPIFRSNIKGRLGIDGKNKYTKITSTMIKALKL